MISDAVSSVATTRESGSSTSSSSDANKTNINLIILSKFINFLDIQPKDDALSDEHQINSLYNTFVNIKQTVDKECAPNSTNIQTIIGVEANNRADKISQINQIISPDGQNTYEHHPTLLKHYAYLYCFAWECSEPSKFAQILEEYGQQYAQGLKRQRGDEEAKVSKRQRKVGGMLPSPNSPNLALPSSSSSRSNFTKRIMIFICILLYLFCLFGLYENVRRLYSSFQNLYDNVSDEASYFEGENTFNVVLFMRVAGRLFMNSFDGTINNIRDLVTTQRIQTMLTDAASSASSAVVNSWDIWYNECYCRSRDRSHFYCSNRTSPSKYKL